MQNKVKGKVGLVLI